MKLKISRGNPQDLNLDKLRLNTRAVIFFLDAFRILSALTI